MHRLYLDHAATTPLAPEVLEAMMPFLSGHFGNPSSLHAEGRAARVAVETARERIAAHLGAGPSEILFTSGGTEADNLALRGVRPEGLLVTSEAEHEAVLRTARALKKSGRPVRFLTPDRAGSVSSELLEAALEEAGPEAARGALVALMHANNEIGTLTDIPAIAEVARRHGALLHCDAVQTAGLFRLDVGALGVDTLAVSGHKLYGPKGVGLLYVRGGVDLAPGVTGGAQERGRRGGTENVAGAVGLAEAFDLAAADDTRAERLAALRDRLHGGLTAALDEAGAGPFVVTTPLGEEAEAEAAPHLLHLAFPPKDGRPLDGEMLLLGLDLAGVAASAGSACTSGALTPSHVLLALGLDRATASAALRFSLGRGTTEADIDEAIARVAPVVARMRGA